MTKSIIIGGVARSGKSTLASLVRQKKPELAFLSGDAFVSTFEKAYPELGIDHISGHENICKNLDNFIFTFMHQMEEEEKAPFVLETFHVMPEQIGKRNLQQKYKAVFMGYPDLTVDQKLEIIFEHDAPDSWTRTVPIETFREWVGEFIDNSKKIRDQCDQYGIPFIDTGALGFESGLEKALGILI